MTKLLEKAFEKASKLSEDEQNILAKWLLEEIESERKWEKSFKDSEDILDNLVKETLDSYEKGKVSKLDFDKL
jgi:Holliday junction resolvase RusA-like endonuclease